MQNRDPLAIDPLRIDLALVEADSSEFGRLLDDLHWPVRVPSSVELDALGAQARTEYGRGLTQVIRDLAEQARG